MVFSIKNAMSTGCSHLKKKNKNKMKQNFSPTSYHTQESIPGGMEIHMSKAIKQQSF